MNKGKVFYQQLSLYCKQLVKPVLVHDSSEGKQYIFRKKLTEEISKFTNEQLKEILNIHKTLKIGSNRRMQLLTIREYRKRKQKIKLCLKEDSEILEDK